MVKRERRDWSVISSDLLFSFAEHLRLADIARLPSVCGGWAWALGSVRRGWPPPPPTLRTTFVPLENSSPWLLLPNEDGHGTEYLDFLRLSECQRGVPRIRISPLLQMTERICVGGSPDGWISTVDMWLNPRILNPLTREEFLLPSLGTLSKSMYTKMIPIYSQEGNGSICMVDFNHPSHNVSFEEFKYHYVRKIIMTSAPPLGVVFLIHGHNSAFSFLAMARVSDLAWCPVLDSPEYDFNTVADVVYNEKDNKFYILSFSGKVIVLDLKNYNWGSVQLPKATVLGSMFGRKCSPGQKYIAFSSSGDLLQIWRQYKCYTLNNNPYPLDEHNFNEESDTSPIAREETISIKIFKFDSGCYDGKNPVSCWVPVKDLGDDAVFLGLSYSTVLTTSDKPWLRRNSVYFVEDTIKSRNITLRDVICDGGIFDLENNTFERFFPYHSKVNWPLPAWFIPSRLQFIL